MGRGKRDGQDREDRVRAVRGGGENSPAPPPFSVCHQGIAGGKGVAILAITMVMVVQAAWAQDGRTQFEARCASCHAMSEAAPPGPGPNLARLAGRRIGGDPNFDYSSVLREAEGVWTADRLATFLEDPEEMFPGLWMGGNGVRDATARRGIVDYLIGR